MSQDPWVKGGRYERQRPVHQHVEARCCSRVLWPGEVQRQTTYRGGSAVGAGGSRGVRDSRRLKKPLKRWKGEVGVRLVLRVVGPGVLSLCRNWQFGGFRNQARNRRRQMWIAISPPLVFHERLQAAPCSGKLQWPGSYFTLMLSSRYHLWEDGRQASHLQLGCF